MPQISEEQRTALLAGLSGLRKFCFSLTGSAADADDLLQTTVERVLAKGLPLGADATKWAYRVSKNAWIDEIRSRDVRQRYPATATDEMITAPSAEESASAEREFAAVSAALRSLPRDQRLALTLVAVEGKTYAEAAEILEVPTGTIMSRVARARRELADRWNDGNND